MGAWEAKRPSTGGELKGPRELSVGGMGGVILTEGIRRHGDGQGGNLILERVNLIKLLTKEGLNADRHATL